MRGIKEFIFQCEIPLKRALYLYGFFAFICPFSAVCYVRIPPFSFCGQQLCNYRSILFYLLCLQISCRSNGQYQVWNGTETDWADRPLLYEKDITAYGIVAPYIVGTILAGQNLIITTEDGSFRVDSSGVHIDSMKLFITQDSSSYDTTLGDKLKELTDADDKTASDLSDAIERINGLDDKIENTVTTYYQDSIPTDAREGDLWYVTGDCYGETEEEVYLQGKLFRYNGKSWDEITDADAISAIEKANKAQATADGKIVTYLAKSVIENISKHTDTFGKNNNITYENFTDTPDDEINMNRDC